MPLNDKQEHADLFYSWQAEYNHPFSGWDFSYLEGRMVEDLSSLTWDYHASIEARLPHIQALLDMGTGGGEILASLSPLPPDTCATEGYPPNIPVARQRLEPLGVHVYEIDEQLHLPLDDARFDLVIDRHEAYLPREVLRVLKSGGLFINQQVHADHYAELNRALGTTKTQDFAHWTLSYAARELEEVGFEILQRVEARPALHFYDVGAIAYYLKAAPWQLPDFSVERYFARLRNLHLQIQREGYIEVHSHYFFIVARKL